MSYRIEICINNLFYYIQVLEYEKNLDTLLKFVHHDLEVLNKPEVLIWSQRSVPDKES